MIRKDYKNSKGLATGLRGALKRQGVTVSQASKWNASNGADVVATLKTVLISIVSHNSYKAPSITEVAKALEAEEVEFTLTQDRFGNDQIEIEASKYCL